MPKYVPTDTSVVYWDGTGPYWKKADGTKSYIPPLVAAQYSDPKMQAWAKSRGATLASDPGGITAGNLRGADMFHKRDTWNDQKGAYERPFDWTGVADIAAGGLIANGAVAAAGGGGSAPAASGTIGSGIETTPTAVPALASGGGPGTAAYGAAAPLGALPTNAGTHGNGGQGQQGLVDQLTSRESLASIASLIPLLMAKNGQSQSEQDSLAQANRMSAITEARMRRVDPLHQAVTQLAWSRLPNNSRDGLTLAPVDLPK